MFDVAVVGCGPAGATAACLLGRLGLATLVIDRARAIYDRPRAFALDHEIMRVFQNIGIAEAVRPFTEPFSASEHYGVDGQLIRRLTMIDPPYPLGWTPSMVFLQPAVEAVLRAQVAATAGVSMALGTELLDLRASRDGVTLQLRDDNGSARKVEARYVIGCDGASSTVRRLVGIEQDDLGFDEPWLVVDVRVNAEGARKLPAVSAQFCEPARPTSFLIGTGNHRRWEIMLLPGEDPREMETDAATWRLLSRWLTPDDAHLWRRASYRFHALVARQWRKGRVFIAGDAAHQQPPFLGQGMCQGIRDVANLTWKIAAVLGGRAHDSLLDTYGAERGAHVRRLTTTIRHIGQGICERDPERARRRDADLIAAAGGTVRSVPRQDLVPPLEAGLVAHDGHATSGTLFPQPRIVPGDRLLDDVAGCGWRVVLGATAPGKAMRSVITKCGWDAIVVDFASLTEADHVVRDWFGRHRCIAAVVRPDHYVYGVAASAQALEQLLHNLSRAAQPAKETQR